MLRRLFLLFALLLPAAASAEWHEATTRHFIVYSDAPEQELRQAATELEKCDHLLRLTLDAPQDVPVKLKVYLMRDMEAVQETMGAGTGGGVAGYYTATSRGPIAVGLRIKDEEDWRGWNRQVLFHEYAHHMMLQHFPSAFPSWYVEGFAEYYGTTKILPNDVIEVGHSASHRRIHASEGWVPLKKLLTARSYRDIDNEVWAVYAQGWLLVHYLTDNPQRKGQLRKYLTAINRGVDYKTAMDAAFGPDAEELDKELRRYSYRGRLEALRITFPGIDVGPIQVRQLRAAEAALIRQEIALGRGIYAREAADFAEKVRKIAFRHPDDAHSYAVLAEAERLAGNRAAAEAAVARWLELQPGAPRALALKGRLEAEALAEAKSPDANRWAEARRLLADARKAAPADPLVLEAFYDVHALDGRLPPPRAQNALFKAMELVPQDDRLRYKVVADFERRGLVEAAIAAVMPMVSRAHSPDEEPDEKKRREKLEEKWREAGAAKRESPHEMLARLQKKLAEGAAAKPAG